MKRIKYLDVARGIAVLTVVFYHTRYLPFQNFILPLITPWMLPSFALVGGLLYRHRKEESFWSFFKRKFRSLMIPYIVFGVASLALWLMIRGAYGGKFIWASLNSQISSLLLGRELVFNGPLWFLPCYFLTTLFIRALYPHLERSTKVQASALMLICFAAFFSPAGKMPYALNLIPLFSFFYLLGIMLRRNMEDLTRSLELFILSMVLFVPLSLSNGTIDLYGTVFHNYFVFILTAVLGTYILLFKARLVVEFYGASILNFLSYLGRHTMTIFAVHAPIMQWVTVVVSRTALFTYAHGAPNLTSFDISFSDGKIFFLFGLGMFVFYSGMSLAGAYLVIRLSEKF